LTKKFESYVGITFPKVFTVILSPIMTSWAVGLNWLLAVTMIDSLGSVNSTFLWNVSWGTERFAKNQKFLTINLWPVRPPRFMLNRIM
jgi:hypothetical protein